MGSKVAQAAQDKTQEAACNFPLYFREIGNTKARKADVEERSKNLHIRRTIIIIYFLSLSQHPLMLPGNSTGLGVSTPKLDIRCWDGFPSAQEMCRWAQPWAARDPHSYSNQSHLGSIVLTPGSAPAKGGGTRPRRKLVRPRPGPPERQGPAVQPLRLVGQEQVFVTGKNWMGLGEGTSKHSGS